MGRYRSPGRALRPAQSDSEGVLARTVRPVAGRWDRAWATDSIRRRAGHLTPRDATEDVVWGDDGGLGETTLDRRGPEPMGERRGRFRRPLFEKETREEACRACGTRPETKRLGPRHRAGHFWGWGWTTGKTCTGVVGAPAIRQFEPLGSMKVSETSTDCASDRTYFRKPPRSASPSARLSRSASNRNVPSSAVSISKNTL